MLSRKIFSFLRKNWWGDYLGFRFMIWDFGLQIYKKMITIDTLNAS
jgi:hypothetical protein